MTWDATRISEVADAYVRYYRLGVEGRGSDRQQSEEFWWAYEEVDDAVADGSLPVDVLDALIHHPDADDRFRAYLAADPIENALNRHPANYGPTVAARCVTDSLWVSVIDGVWLDEPAWAALPDDLRRRIVPHHTASITTPATAKARKSKKSRKRQGRRPRHP